VWAMQLVALPCLSCRHDRGDLRVLPPGPIGKPIRKFS